MKLSFILALMCLCTFSMAQNDLIKIGNKNFKKMSFSNNLTMYHSLCENHDDYYFASQSVIRYDSLHQIGYLRSYNYENNFDCQEILEDSIREQVKATLSAKKNTRRRVGILFNMEDKNNEFIAILMLFRKGKFKKFIKNTNKLFTKKYSGEKISMSEFNYTKYADELILAKVSNKLSLIQSQR